MGIAKPQGPVCVDSSDQELLVAHEWRRHPYGYVSRKAKTADGKWNTVLLHRAILHAKTGEVVDHINHDILDNRRGNLRITDRSGNMGNSHRHRDNALGLKGVTKREDLRATPFAARIMVAGKTHHLGYFASAEKASRAYDAKARELFGEFAKLNDV